MRVDALKDEIDRRLRLGEEAAERGDRMEAAYQLGYTNALKRWRQALREAQERTPWALLRLNGAVYLGYQYRPESWRFDRLAGNGPRDLRATVQDGVARRRKERLGPVVFLPEAAAASLNEGAA
jgi:hypothetical protein